MNLNDLSHIPYSELSKELEKGGKFVCYTYTISVIFMTFRRPSQVYFLKSNESKIISASEFSPGIYLYALMADGKELDIKRMILTD